MKLWNAIKKVSSLILDLSLPFKASFPLFVLEIAVCPEVAAKVTEDEPRYASFAAKAEVIIDSAKMMASGFYVNAAIETAKTIVKVIAPKVAIAIGNLVSKVLPVLAPALPYVPAAYVLIGLGLGFYYFISHYPR